MAAQTASPVFFPSTMSVPSTTSHLDAPSGSNGFLGTTIEEKTRSILGWTETYTPSYNISHSTRNNFSPVQSDYQSVDQSTPAGGKKGGPQRKNSKSGQLQGQSYPYNLLGTKSGVGRSRKTSLSGGGESLLKQQLTPPPSPAGSVASSFHHSASTPHLGSRVAPISPDSSYGSLPISPLSPNTPSCSVGGPFPPGGYAVNGLVSMTPAGPTSPSMVPPLRHPLAPSLSSPGQGACTTDGHVFDRLRELVPHIPTDRNAYQVLIKTVMSVIELEHELEALKQKTEGVRNILSQQQCSPSENTQQQQPSPTQSSASSSPSSPWEHTVPDDLAGIDVSAFKSLVSVPRNLS